jgi:hypothetical protein
MVAASTTATTFASTRLVAMTPLFTIEDGQNRSAAVTGIPSARPAAAEPLRLQ